MQKNEPGAPPSVKGMLAVMAWLVLAILLRDAATVGRSALPGDVARPTLTASAASPEPPASLPRPHP